MLVHKIRFRPLFKLETQNYKKRQRHVSMFLLTMNHENQWHSARKWINQCYSTSECCQVDFFHRSSRPEVYCKKGVLRNFVKLTGKHLCQSLFLNKVAGLRTATVLKKILLHRSFPVNFEKFLRTRFLQYSSGRLLLIWVRWVHSFSVI